jgi:hypothetical protein
VTHDLDRMAVAEQALSENGIFLSTGPDGCSIYDALKLRHPGAELTFAQLFSSATFVICSNNHLRPK